MRKKPWKTEENIINENETAQKVVHEFSIDWVATKWPSTYIYTLMQQGRKRLPVTEHTCNDTVVVYSHRKMRDDLMVKMVISGKLKVIEISLLPWSFLIRREKYRLDRLIPWFSS